MRNLLIFSFISLFLISCQKEVQKEQANEPIVMEGDAYGSTFRIVYYSYDKNFNEEIQQILEEFDHSVNTYIPTSILTKFNESENGSSADRMLLELVSISRNYNTKTNGFYDPSVSPLSDLWGFSSKGIKHSPSDQQVDSVMQFIGLKNISILENALSKTDARVALSFNAITGYVNDEVAKFLDSKKVESYLIEIGGEMIAKGKKPNGDAWTIGIDEPIENANKRVLNSILELNNEAMATSGNYRKFHIDEETGQKIVHTMNPKTGYPEISPLLSASVIAPTCAEADATATALMAMGLDKALEYIPTRPELKFYLIWSDENGNYVNKAFNGFELKKDKKE